MLPIAYGIIAVAGFLLSGCGGGDNEGQAAGTPRDGDGGSSGTGNNTSTGAGNNTSTGTGNNTSTGTGGSSTTGTGGSGGSGGATTTGVGGSGGAGGSGGIGTTDGGMDAGGMAGDTGAGGTGGDAGLPIAEPYRFGMVYGPDSDDIGVRTQFHLNGTGALLFSELDACQLIGGQFTAQYAEGFVDPEYTNLFGDPTFELSINLAAGESINACEESVVLPLSGGLFEGVNWFLDVAEQSAGAKDAWTIAECDPDPEGSGEVCSGELKLITQ